MEPQAENVIELTLEFEALAHADRTRIAWERLDYAAMELVQVELDGPDRSADEVVEVPHRTWEQFLELVLSSVLPERSAPASDDSATLPEIKTPDQLTDIPDVGRHEPDAPTSPTRPAAVSFMRCTVSLGLDNGSRTSVIEGNAAMELYSRVYGFAREVGLPLPD